MEEGTSVETGPDGEPYIELVPPKKRRAWPFIVAILIGLFVVPVILFLAIRRSVDRAERDAQYTPTESERESMMIDAIRSHGLAEPVRQFVVRDEHGVFVGRVDLAYPELMITIEYDSYQEHVGKQALVRDSRRRNAIAALGYCTLVATAEDVRFGQGHALASAIKRARARASELPTLLTTEPASK